MNKKNDKKNKKQKKRFNIKCFCILKASKVRGEDKVMKNLFLNQSINAITKYNPNYNSEELEKLKYGLEGIYLTITKTIVLLLLSITFRITKEVLLILALFNFLRYFAFGFHAETSKQCLIISSLQFIGLPLIIFYSKLSLLLKGIIAITCTIKIMILAPADTIKRPLPNKKKRLIRKIISTLIALIYTFVIIISKNKLSEIFLCALIIQMINVSPIIYKIFKQPYNNYKNYTHI